MIRLPLPRAFLVLFLSLLISAATASRLAAALGDVPFVDASATPGSFPLAVSGRAAPIVTDPSDWDGVRRAANDLQADVQRVTGLLPARAEATALPASGDAVIVGTVGRSALIDALVRSGKLDVSDLRGKWEAFVVAVVDRPAPGLPRALVIAGSDKRGAIYGLYEVSEQIGVSPWYWWADVPVRHRAELHVRAVRFASGEPVVKYRGIFLNDEAPALAGWARAKFGGLNHVFYERLFELMLRLRANYLWPAMWNNAFNEDDPLNPKVADDYGIVMGTSHHEPMLRSQQEWKRHGKGDWNYSTNADELRSFWSEGIRRNKAFESIVTVGMRGDGDLPMSEESNVALLERIVADQRSILAREMGRPASEIPQLWALYKEVQAYYEKGMRVPDDVTLLWCDDNWGNIRRLPTPSERNRPGGAGVYYHFDYVGGPRSYKWINTNPLPRVWEQMNLACENGATRIWIVNVGDLKPMEFPTEFFLNLAWDPGRWNQDSLGEFGRLWAAREFGTEHAAEIASLVEGYARINGRRKPELLDPATYSLVNEDEAGRVTAECDALVAKARRLEGEIDPSARDAFFELVLHPVEATAIVNELAIAAGRNRLYAVQGRASANAWADRARALFAEDAALSRRYNEQTAGGKWPHMMDQTHIGYTYWQQPQCNVMPAVSQVQVPEAPAVAVAVEGSPHSWPSYDPFAKEARLPELSPCDPAPHYFELFNRGLKPASFRIVSSVPWLHVSASSGTLSDDLRVTVSVDWSAAPSGHAEAALLVKGDVSAPVPIVVPVFKPDGAEEAGLRGFVEADGVVSMEAPHFSRALEGQGIRWVAIPGLGRTLGGVTTLPSTAAPSEPGGASPHLEYDFHLFTAGEVRVHVLAAPTLAYAPGRGVRCAVSLDDGAPVVLDIQADRSEGAWNRAVSDEISVVVAKLHVDKPGAHVLKFWRVDPGFVLEKLVIDAGGLRPSYLGPVESLRFPRG